MSQIREHNLSIYPRRNPLSVEAGISQSGPVDSTKEIH